jgi:uncharacterized coiled-coil DUF342 family protein
MKGGYKPNIAINRETLNNSEGRAIAARQARAEESIKQKMEELHKDAKRTPLSKQEEDTYPIRDASINAKIQSLEQREITRESAENKKNMEALKGLLTKGGISNTTDSSVLETVLNVLDDNRISLAERGYLIQRQIEQAALNAQILGIKNAFKQAALERAAKNAANNISDKFPKLAYDPVKDAFYNTLISEVSSYITSQQKPTAIGINTYNNAKISYNTKSVIVKGIVTSINNATIDIVNSLAGSYSLKESALNELKIVGDKIAALNLSIFNVNSIISIYTSRISELNKKLGNRDTLRNKVQDDLKTAITNKNNAEIALFNFQTYFTTNTQNKIKAIQQQQHDVEQQINAIKSDIGNININQLKIDLSVLVKQRQELIAAKNKAIKDALDPAAAKLKGDENQIGISFIIMNNRYNIYISVKNNRDGIGLQIQSLISRKPPPTSNIYLDNYITVTVAYENAVKVYEEAVAVLVNLNNANKNDSNLATIIKRIIAKMPKPVKSATLVQMEAYNQYLNQTINIDLPYMLQSAINFYNTSESIMNGAIQAITPTSDLYINMIKDAADAAAAKVPNDSSFEILNGTKTSIADTNKNIAALKYDKDLRIANQAVKVAGFNYTLMSFQAKSFNSNRSNSEKIRSEQRSKADAIKNDPLFIKITSGEGRLINDRKILSDALYEKNARLDFLIYEVIPSGYAIENIIHLKGEIIRFTNIRNGTTEKLNTEIQNLPSLRDKIVDDTQKLEDLHTDLINRDTALSNANGALNEANIKKSNLELANITLQIDRVYLQQDSSEIFSFVGVKNLRIIMNTIAVSYTGIYDKNRADNNKFKGESDGQRSSSKSLADAARLSAIGFSSDAISKNRNKGDNLKKISDDEAQLEKISQDLDDAIIKNSIISNLESISLILSREKSKLQILNGALDTTDANIEILTGNLINDNNNFADSFDALKAAMNKLELAQIALNTALEQNDIFEGQNASMFLNITVNETMKIQIQIYYIIKSNRISNIQIISTVKQSYESQYTIYDNLRALKESNRDSSNSNAKQYRLLISQLYNTILGLQQSKNIAQNNIDIDGRIILDINNKIRNTNDEITPSNVLNNYYFIRINGLDIINNILARLNETYARIGDDININDTNVAPYKTILNNLNNSDNSQRLLEAENAIKKLRDDRDINIAILNDLNDNIIPALHQEVLNAQIALQSAIDEKQNIIDNEFSQVNDVNDAYNKAKIAYENALALYKATLDSLNTINDILSTIDNSNISDAYNKAMKKAAKMLEDLNNAKNEMDRLFDIYSKILDEANIIGGKIDTDRIITDQPPENFPTKPDTTLLEQETANILDEMKVVLTNLTNSKIDSKTYEDALKITQSIIDDLNNTLNNDTKNLNDVNDSLERARKILDDIKDLIDTNMKAQSDLTYTNTILRNRDDILTNLYSSLEIYVKVKVARLQTSMELDAISKLDRGLANNFDINMNTSDKNREETKNLSDNLKEKFAEELSKLQQNAEDLSDKKNKLNDLNNQLEAIELSLNEAYKQKNHNNNELDEIYKKLRDAITERDKILEGIKRVEDDINNLDPSINNGTKLDDLKKQLDDLKRIRDELNNNINELNLRISKLNEDNIRLQREIDDLNKLKNSLNPPTDNNTTPSLIENGIKFLLLAAGGFAIFKLFPFTPLFTPPPPPDPINKKPDPDDTFDSGYSAGCPGDGTSEAAGREKGQKDGYAAAKRQYDTWKSQQVKADIEMPSDDTTDDDASWAQKQLQEGGQMANSVSTSSAEQNTTTPIAQNTATTPIAQNAAVVAVTKSAFTDETTDEGTDEVPITPEQFKLDVSAPIPVPTDSEIPIPPPNGQHSQAWLNGYIRGCRDCYRRGYAATYMQGMNSFVAPTEVVKPVAKSGDDTYFTSTTIPTGEAYTSTMPTGEAYTSTMPTLTGIEHDEEVIPTLDSSLAPVPVELI